MSTFKFLSLPLEIQLNVVDFVRRPAHLLALCLTDKRLKDMVLPRLYHTLVIPVGSEFDFRWQKMLVPNNPGLSLIRRVHLDASHRIATIHGQSCDCGFCENEVNYDFNYGVNRSLRAFTQQILQMLPKNSLEGIEVVFRYADWEFPTAIFDQQNSLTYFRTSHCKPDRTNMTTRVFPKLKTLVCESFNVDEFGLVKDFLLNHPGIEHLSARQVSCPSRPRGIMTQSHCQAWSYLHDETQLSVLKLENIKSLELQGVDFECCGEIWVQAIAFQRLSKLVIDDCRNTASFFRGMRHLCEASTALTDLRWSELSDVDELRLTSFEDLLQGFQGLTKLFVRLSKVERLPVLRSIQVHSSTLRVLSVSSSSRKVTHVYSSEQIDLLCSCFIQLTQLSLSMQPDHVFRSMKEDLLCHDLISLRSLVSLRTLCINNWPWDESFNTETSGTGRWDYLGLLRTISDTILARGSSSGQSKLRTIAFGTTGRTMCPFNNFERCQVVFVRDLTKDLNKVLRDRDHGVVGWNELINLEPEIDILSHAFGKCELFDNMVPIIDGSNEWDDDWALNPQGGYGHNTVGING